MTGVKATMPMFARALERTLQRKVVDETGLQAAYTFKLQFVPEENTARLDADVASHSDGPSLVNALREQLGLSLRADKGPVEVLVIDHGERPSGN